MINRKLVSTLGLCLATISLFSQSLNEENLCQYIQVKGEERTYQGQIYKNIYPQIVTGKDDPLSQFMNKFSRRFEYVLMNRTEHVFRDSIFQGLFPDTNQMSLIYCNQVAANVQVMDYINSLSFPDEVKTKMVFSEEELLKVASRFFLCDAVNPDTSIYWHVCIGLNGQEAEGWQKDYTLLEAFCFEAIFDGLSDKRKATFMNNFIAYVKQAEDTYKELPFDELLIKARKKVFSDMESDQDLINLLLDYYESTKETLPFRVVE